MNMENEVFRNHIDPSFKKRKSRIKSKGRIQVRRSNQTYLFIYTYAMKHELYIEEAADDILRIGIQKLHFQKGIPLRTSINDSAYLINDKASYY
ncbi:MAG: hypothetical protein GY863_24040 [bacterium]|nr:hypothetical protein [bacterium]